MGGGRVLLVHPSAELYGSDRVAQESARAFRDKGAEVTVTVTEPGPLVELLRADGYPVLVVPAPVLRKSYLSLFGLFRFAAVTLRRTWGMIATLRRIRPEAVYVSTVTVPWWLLWARLTGARVLCHVHEAEEDLPRPLRLALASPLLLSHRIVANSEISREVLVSALPRLADRIEVVYNGVPGPREVSPPRQRLVAPVRLVLIGRISPRKGTDVAVKALALLRDDDIDVRLDLVGGVFPGYEWFEEQVRAEAADLGLSEVVRWRGVRSRIWDCLAEADIALVPSRVEPFGNAAVEAMLAGRPVVAGDTQGLREIVRPGENGRLSRAGDEADLAGMISAMVRDWPGTLAQAEYARTEAERRFAPSTYRAKVAEILDRL
jgi:glycosyltransferase involved in cell wall biosynthesis